MKSIILLFASTIFVLLSCQNKKMQTLNSPLVSVIKLNTSEVAMNFEEAKKYQDINKIYSKYLDSNNTNPEDVWKGKITFSYNLAKDKKFTNQWEYFDYDITETIDGNNAEVILKSKKNDSNLQSITYKLTLEKATWIVNEIEYKKNK